MGRESAFTAAENYKPAALVEFRGASLASSFDEPAAEYEAASNAAVLFDRSDRGLVRVTGADRKSWLNNLVTNAVNTLDDNTGNYAFACNRQGKLQFDLNILNLPEEILLDLDGQAVGSAIAHLEKCLITEDAALTDTSCEFARLACSGPAAADVAARLGVANLSPMASLSSMAVDRGAVRMFRHDLAGGTAFELILPAGEAAAWWDRLVHDCGARPAGLRTLETLRIEAGIPRWAADLDDSVLPAETGQLERAVSFSKGCYLGQELVERMRSFGSLAKRLVRLSIEDGEGIDLPQPLLLNGADVGRLTSLVRHPLSANWIGLGYLKTSVADSNGLSTSDPARTIALRE